MVIIVFCFLFEMEVINNGIIVLCVNVFVKLFVFVNFEFLWWW